MKQLAPLAFVLVSWPAMAEQVCDTTELPVSAPVERFQDNGDGTVTDRTNQLMWMRCSVGQIWADGTCNGTPDLRDWAAANDYAEEVNRSGTFFYTDWRIPKLPELASIAERSCKDPRINLTVFPATPTLAYWTSTPRPGPVDEAVVYALDFGVDGVVPELKNQQHLVRLVRTGP